MFTHILEAFLKGDLSGAIWSGLGELLSGGRDALQERFNELTGRDSIQEWLSDLADDWLPDFTTAERAKEVLDELLENVITWKDEVVSDIGDAVQDILDTGDIQAQTDGGLGETHDIFTPEGEGPELPVGEIPGFGTEGGGMGRDSGGGGYADSGYGGGTEPGGTTPLGETGEPPAEGPPQPTYEDLGIDPDSGAYIEYHPGEGEVVITYPDGTTETRPWP